MSAKAIHRILASSPKATGPRASANIMTYSPRTHAITSLLHDDVIIVGANISYWHCGQCHILQVIKNIENVTGCRDTRTAKSKETREG